MKRETNVCNFLGSGQVSFVSKLEEDQKSESTNKFSARALFQNRDKTGQSDVADTVLNTTHQNQVYQDIRFLHAEPTF